MLAGAGGVDHDKLVGLAEKYFGQLGTEYEGEVPTLSPCRFTGSEVSHQDIHFILGFIPCFLSYFM